MAQFKTWKDYYSFLRDYGVFTCLNCHFGAKEVYGDDEEHKNSDYAYVFCTNQISMVRLDMMTVCGKWTHKDTGKELEDYDDDISQWNLPDQIIDKLDEVGKEWSIEEVRELVSENEELKE